MKARVASCQHCEHVGYPEVATASRTSKRSVLRCENCHGAL